MRAFTRFNPDPLDYALIDFRHDKNSFSPSAVGLILNESYAGCALVIKTKESLVSNTNLRIQVGKIGVLSAKIIWVKTLGESLVQAGIQFLE